MSRVFYSEVVADNNIRAVETDVSGFRPKEPSGAFSEPQPPALLNSKTQTSVESAATPKKAPSKKTPRAKPKKGLEGAGPRTCALPGTKPDSADLFFQSGTEAEARLGGPPAPHSASDSRKSGRWTMDEHFRFLEALQRFGKEWKRVQQHVGTRSSTQARSHAQKFFVKLDRKKQTLENFLTTLNLESVRQRMLDAGSNQDYEDLDNYSTGPQSLLNAASLK